MAVPSGQGPGLELDRARIKNYHDLVVQERFASAHAGQASDQMITDPNR
jgi:hypothetical protein